MMRHEWKWAGAVLLWMILSPGCSSNALHLGDTPDAGLGADGSVGYARADECGNGIDDDDNGLIDDGCPCGPRETQACFSGPIAVRGFGACMDGVQTCQLEGSAEWGDWGDSPCVGDTTPASEMCDGSDRDCDGAIDDGCPCTVGETRSCGDASLPSPCRAGNQSCGAEGLWSACEGAIGPSADVCGDGIDNDCDGTIDDVCDCVPSVELCRDGIDNDCDGIIDEPACSPDALCSPEVCGGGDEDCDGTIDEGCESTCECTVSRFASFGALSVEAFIAAPTSVTRDTYYHGARLLDDSIALFSTQSNTRSLGSHAVRADATGMVLGEVPGLRPVSSVFGPLAVGNQVIIDYEPYRSYGMIDLGTAATRAFDPSAFLSTGATMIGWYAYDGADGPRFLWIECRSMGASGCTDTALVHQSLAADGTPAGSATTLASGAVASGWTEVLMATHEAPHLWISLGFVDGSSEGTSFYDATSGMRVDSVTLRGGAHSIMSAGIASHGDRVLHCFSFFPTVVPRTLCRHHALDGAALGEPFEIPRVWSNSHQFPLFRTACGFAVVSSSGSVGVTPVSRMLPSHGTTVALGTASDTIGSLGPEWLATTVAPDGKPRIIGTVPTRRSVTDGGYVYNLGGERVVSSDVTCEVSP